VKTCTSRLGSRLEEFVVDGLYFFQVNDGSYDHAIIKVTNAYVKQLKSLTKEEAKAIGNYSPLLGIKDVIDTYTKLGREVNEDSMITVVWFEKTFGLQRD